MELFSISSTSGSNPIHVLDNAAWKTAHWTWAYRMKVSPGATTTGVFSTSLLGNGTLEGLGCELYGGTLYFDMPGGRQIPCYASGDAIWHSYAFTYDGSVVRLYVDGVMVNSQPSVPAVVWGVHDLVIAKFGNTRCRLTDPRIYSEALSDADVAALAAGTDVTANLVAHWPCTEGSGTTLTDVINGLNSVGPPISWVSYDNEPTAPYLDKVIITPSRQWLRATPLQIDQTSAINAISAVADGGTYTVNGVTRPLLDPCFAAVGWPDVLWPLSDCPLVGYLIADDSDGAWSSTGTWTEVLQSSSPGGYFTTFNNQFHVSSEPSATATWPFTGLTAHRYAVYISRDVVDTGRTMQAVYTVKDGTGTMLDTFSVDLSHELRWDVIRDNVLGPEVHRIGYINIPTGQTSLTVTISNGAGSGTLAADAVLLEPEFLPTVQSGDVVTVSLPAGTIIVGGLPLAEAINFPVAIVDDLDFIPVLPPEERTMGCGANIEQPVGPWHVHLTANRGISSNFEGDVTLDGNGEMTANTGTARRLMSYAPMADGNLTSRGGYTVKDGMHRFEFTVSGATFDATAQSNTSIIDSTGDTVIGAPVFTNLGSNHWRMTQSVARLPWLPISERTRSSSWLWSPYLYWTANTPGVIYTQWRWYDPSVPADWDKTVHPTLYAQVTDDSGVGWMAAGRTMDALSTNNSVAWRVGDLLTPAEESGGNTLSRILVQTNVNSIRPVNFDAAGDPDCWQRYFSTNGITTLQDSRNPSQSGWLVADVDDATGFANCGGAYWGGPNSFPATLGGTIVIQGLRIARIDNTHLIIATYPTGSPYDPNMGADKATLAASHSLTGCNLANYRVINQVSLETLLDVFRECGIPPWINIPNAANDTLITSMATTTRDRTPADSKIYVEYGNENWNPAFGQYNYMDCKSKEANFLHAQDPTTYPYEYSAVGAFGWQAHRAYQCRQIFRQVWIDAGRDPNLIQGLCGLQMGSFAPCDGAVHVINNEGAVFEGYAPAAYQDASPVTSDINGPDLAATFQRVDENGLIDSLWTNVASGRWADWNAGFDAHMAPAGLTDVPYVTYEGGWSTVVPSYGRTSGQQARITNIVMANPRIFRMTGGLQSIYQKQLKLLIDVRYTHNYYSIPGATDQWSDVITAYQRPGTGDPAENPNPFDWPNVVSQTLGGRRAFATGYDFNNGGGITPSGLPRLKLTTPAGRLSINVG